MTDYRYENVNNKCCSDFQDTRGDCPVNASFYPIIEAYFAQTESAIYDSYSYELFPMLTIRLLKTNVPVCAGLTL